ncbi:MULTISPECIES: Tm-1-like ATP-binding domain-containing protein [unclassified Roseovarius]|uniref:Tm-1-like ATP-binding domain-containing protein n=1 Tax=unclassified Roseovarius TaxID=2614913 RepID=UPI00273DBB97|nr:Tm-1-like ATP-binding domain-containing protein [Roseovarius sp. MMSF_3350]
MTAARVYVVGTFDTKAEELAYVAGIIRETGMAVTTVDVGTTATPAAADIPAADVAAHHPDGASRIFEAGDRGRAVIAMSEALTRFVATRSDIAGIIGLGGSGGTSLITPAMRALPLGLPKLMVSTVASGDTSGYVGVSDLTMMFPVTDIAGLNTVSRRILANAAQAIAGMAAGNHADTTGDTRPALALSMFGVTTKAVRQLRARLDNEFDCIVFHANGAGGRALEAIGDSGMVTAIVDVTTTEVADHLMGGICSAGPERFDVLARTGIPWIGSCGALDMVNFGPRETVPDRYEGRQFFVHNANITLMRTTPDENAEMARWLAAKLNASPGPVDLVLPLGGVSALDAPDEAFWNPQADEALFETLEAAFDVSETHQLHRLDAHINDAVFADFVECLVRDRRNG